MSTSDTSGHELETTVRLVTAAKGGDEAALADLLDRYLPAIRRIVSLRLGWRLRRIVEIDDVVQDVVIRILRGLDRFEHRSDGSFRDWLARCVENEIADTARALGRARRGNDRVRRAADLDSSFLLDSLASSRAATPSELAAAGELAERLEDALLAMRPHERELVILRVLCNLPYEEIADRLHVRRVDSVRVGLSRALARLRKLAGLR